MVELPKVKVGIVSCSGEEIPEGTISRLAARKVLDKLRPQQTSTICLPLFLAGGKEDREFARVYPTITVDGCEKFCARKATEKYSGKVSASINVRDFVKEGETLVNRRDLGQKELEVADRVAQEIAARVDDIESQKGATKKYTKEEVVSDDEVSDASQAGCSCGSGEIPYIEIDIHGKKVKLFYLKEIFDFVSQDGDKSDVDIADHILNLVRTYNVIDDGMEQVYKDAIVKEYRSYIGGGK
jgi:CHASE2 domain-containing sensor protein